MIARFDIVTSLLGIRRRMFEGLGARMPSAGPVRMLAPPMLRLLSKILYWMAVLAVSIVLLVLLVRFFESRDESELEGAGAAPPALTA
jgi:hypothetical protein